MSAPLPQENEEIEITPEMIRAGTDVLLWYGEELSAWALAEAVYRAMELVKRDRRKNDHQ